MKSISILGCGWLGKPLAVALLKSGYRVYGSTTQESKLAELELLGIKPFLIEFNQYDIAEHLEFFQADTLIISIPPKRKSGQTDIYLQQLNNVVTEILKGSISTVLFVSSTAVYEDGDRTVTENDADSASYLVQAENIFRDQRNFKTTVVRFGGLVGPGRNPGKFLAGKKDVQGGHYPVNVIHQADCIGIIKSIIDLEVWGEVFNACADHHPTRRAFYGHASSLLKLETPQFSDTDMSKNKVVSCERLRAQLHYNFIHSDPMKMLEFM